MLRQRVLTESPILNVMIEAAQKAGRGLVRDFGEIEKLQVSRKGPGDFVSNADKKAERRIEEILLKARPDFSFLMEESGEKKGLDTDNRWIIDPLDGTMNFLHGIPAFAVSIGYEKQGEIVAGVIYDPILDELFWAEKSKGAFMNSERLRVAGRKNIQESLFMTDVTNSNPESKKISLKRQESLLNEGAIIRMLGSTVLGLAYVASGRADGYFGGFVQPWDVAAGIIIVREAGGFVQEIGGGSHPEVGKSLIATNIDLLESLDKTVK
jgi:myo-inositol-1(or 4)-monophosphatase